MLAVVILVRASTLLNHNSSRCQTRFKLYATGLGRFPELVRAAGARRSAHPLYSLAALGPHAAGILAEHTWSFGLGRHSPLSGFVAEHRATDHV